jgi:hypothetical protein
VVVGVAPDTHLAGLGSSFPLFPFHTLPFFFSFLPGRRLLNSRAQILMDVWLFAAHSYSVILLILSFDVAVDTVLLFVTQSSKAGTRSLCREDIER